MAFLSSLLVVRLMGTEAYGLWSLAQSFLVIWQSLDLTGVNVSTSTHLAIAAGAKNAPEILDVMAVYVKISLLWALVLIVGIGLTGPFLSARLYSGDTRIGVLAFWLSLGTLPDAIYSLFVIALQSQRSMRSVAVLTNINQFVLLACTAVALLISPTPENLVAGRLAYSTITMLVALVFYQRSRLNFSLPYPSFREVIGRVRSVSPRRYWRFGLLSAVDKNVANLYTEFSLQLVGIFAGKAAAGYLELGFKALTIPAILTSAVFDNLQAAVPQAVGRRDFRTLWRNFNRVLFGLALGAVVFYAAFALALPLVVPLIYGHHWKPAIPAIVALSVFGAVTMVGGIFGPLYRSLNLLRSAIVVKIVALVAVLLPGWLLLQPIHHLSDLWSLGGRFPVAFPELQQAGSVVGAWMVNGLYIVSIVLTAVVTLPVLKDKAAQDSEP